MQEDPRRWTWCYPTSPRTTLADAFAIPPRQEWFAQEPIVLRSHRPPPSLQRLVVCQVSRLRWVARPLRPFSRLLIPGPWDLARISVDERGHLPATNLHPPSMGKLHSSTTREVNSPEGAEAAQDSHTEAAGVMLAVCRVPCRVCLAVSFFWGAASCRDRLPLLRMLLVLLLLLPCCRVGTHDGPWAMGGASYHLQPTRNVTNGPKGMG